MKPEVYCPKPALIKQVIPKTNQQLLLNWLDAVEYGKELESTVRCYEGQ
jgi:hypothetical protein